MIAGQPPADLASQIGTWGVIGGAAIGAIILILSKGKALPDRYYDLTTAWANARRRAHTSSRDALKAELENQVADAVQAMRDQDASHKAAMARQAAELAAVSQMQVDQLGQIRHLWSAVSSLRQYSWQAHNEITRLNPHTDFPRPPDVIVSPWVTIKPAYPPQQ